MTDKEKWERSLGLCKDKRQEQRKQAEVRVQADAVLKARELVEKCPHRGGWVAASRGCNGVRTCAIGKGSFKPGEVTPADCLTCKTEQLESRPKLAILCPVANYGGTEEWVRVLAANLDRDRIDLLAIGLPPPASTDSPMLAEWEKVAPLIWGIYGCRELVAKADIVLCAWVFNLPWLLYQHYPNATAEPNHHSRPRPAVVMVSHIDITGGWLDKLNGQPDIDFFAAVSEHALAPIPEKHRPSTKIITNAIDPERLVPTRNVAEVRAELNIPPHVPVLGYLGRLEPNQKDPAGLIRALDHLPGWHGLWVGNSHDDGAWLKAEAEHLGDRAHFAGGRRDIGNYFQVMTRLMMPSRYEACALVALEAWAFGLPLLMTLTGVGVDVPGLSCPIHIDADGPTLAAAVLADTNSPEAITRARTARAWVTSTRSPESFGRMWTDYLVECAKTPRQSKPQTPMELNFVASATQPAEVGTSP
jgi:glycosyltransferase involved in cell wall biosynthesis